MATRHDAPPDEKKRPLRILCVDDHAQMLLLTQLTLERAGHAVTCEEDGLQAWHRILREHEAFDVIITDHQMPCLTGLELVKKLRAIDYPAKIIVQSSLLLPEEREQLAVLRVDAVLQKPASIQHLLQEISRWA